MAQINDSISTAKPKAGVKRMSKNSMRIDMTPMVDLGFLLITFFVFTAQLSKPTAMDIAMPKDSVIDHITEIGESYVITVLPTGSDIYYYEGFFEKAKNENRIHKTTLTDLRRAIMQKKKILGNKAIYKEGAEGLMILIKPSAEANYKSIIDALDECTIGDVKKYALVEVSEEERIWLAKK
jgi:biopolymer transport protein ExbD